MSVTTIPTAAANSNQAKGSASNGIERRRRRRVKISAQVHVRAVNSPEPLEEICRSVDVSRDGLLFVTSRPGYWKGQTLDVTFPYSDAAQALNQAQRSEVVRTAPIEGGLHHVAVQFHAAKAEAKSDRKGAGQSDAFSGSGATTSPLENMKQQAVVLVAEPDARAADSIRAMLVQDGYTVVVVKSAQEALEVLRTTVPVAVLANVEGEEMSGHDLCLIVKRNDRLQHVPVILLTKSAQPADYSSSHQLGAVVCMAKPFKPERLRNVVRLVAPPPKVGGSAYGVSRSGSVERAL
ncbi:MAG TPA: response regulator [Verrucomicrobiae bacterium]|nr:response regulator [Verrucomicrobiae bacterium]